MVSDIPVALLPSSSRFGITVPANGGVTSVFHGFGQVGPPVKFTYTELTFGSVTASVKLAVAVESNTSVAVTVIFGYTPTVPADGTTLIVPVPFPLSVKVANGGRPVTLNVSCTLGSSTVVTL